MAADKSGEFRGKSVEAAISSGLAALGLTRDEVEVEIVRPGSRGLLGIGAEDAVVRLSALSASSGEPVVRSEPAQAPTQAPAAPTGPSQPSRPEPRPAQRSEPRQAPKPRSAPRPAAAGPAESAPILDTLTDPKERAAIEAGRDILAGLLQRMGLAAHVEIVPQSEAELDEDEPALVLNIVGDDLGVLIGRQSEVLSSLQFITRLMVNQQTRSRTNVIVDVNGYKAKRAESLRKLALRTADQVVQTGRTMSLEPMPPAERRIIHLTLRNHANVTTESVGEGSKRKVTVIPKK
jgi:spoIIIJ-associated protein